MKQLLDFLPLVLFFIFYKLYDLYVATSVLIVATGLVVLMTWIMYRKVEKITLFTFLMVAVFGGLTVALRDPNFIIWKVTILYTLFAIALGLSQFVFKKTLIQRLLGKDLSLPSKIWNKINILWALFFLFCGLINLYVAFHFSENAWVTFKSFGLTGATFIFMIITIIYVYPHLLKSKEALKSAEEQDND